MAKLSIFGNEITSVFQLLGTKENDISYSVGYSLANSNKFLENFLKHINITIPFEPDKIRVQLQTHEKAAGFTDFEIIQDGEFHIIVEAKRGWIFPDAVQLNKYALRQSFAMSNAKDKRILIFNESTPAYIGAYFATPIIQNIPVTVISWNNIQQIVANSKLPRKITDNSILAQLNTYLEKISTMQKKDSNWVYVVSLGQNVPAGWSISFKDIVVTYNQYFHPIAGKGGWPSEPPNYIAFRYNGKLQSIHHIDKYEVFHDPSLHFKEIPKGNWGPHYLYHLGPAIRPAHTVTTGSKITQSMRVRAMLDLLLTSQTIEEARDRSKLR